METARLRNSPPRNPANGGTELIMIGNIDHKVSRTTTFNGKLRTTSGGLVSKD